MILPIHPTYQSESKAKEWRWWEYDWWRSPSSATKKERRGWTKKRVDSIREMRYSSDPSRYLSNTNKSWLCEEREYWRWNKEALIVAGRGWLCLVIAGNNNQQQAATGKDKRRWKDKTALIWSVKMSEQDQVHVKTVMRGYESQKQYQTKMKPWIVALRGDGLSWYLRMRLVAKEVTCVRI